jgi:high-affinity gluconate transporter
MANILPLVWVLIGIALLIIFITKIKMHAILALMISAIFVAFAERMPIDKIVATIQLGLSSILGTLTLIIIFGAIIGKLMTESGASQQIADTIISRMGVKYLQFALLIVGTLFGMAMFYEVAFLITAPLVISIAKKANIPYMKLIVPLVAGATMGHSIFPPQPGPMALVTAFNANISLVYVLGFIVIVPSIICSGVILTKFIPGINHMPLGDIMAPAEPKPANELPSFGISLFVPLLPAILMVFASAVQLLLTKNSELYKIAAFLGSAEISMLIAVLVGILAFGVRRGRSGQQITDTLTGAISGVSNVLLVIAAGGIMKEVIINTGIGNTIVALVEHVPVSPLILAWVITVIIRLLTGQGAVAAITAAGIVAPMIAAFHVNPVLMVLTCAVGSNTMTLMYDGGFLLFQQSFKISMKDTFKTWGLLELVNSVVGLAMVMLLSVFVH